MIPPDLNARDRMTTGPGADASEPRAASGSRLVQGFAARPLLWLTLGAIGLRLLLLLGRGHYVAFDEGWYLLLGRNLWGGDGYTLSGLDHVALSPLFPILAGALEVLMGEAVWAGRMVAAVAAGLLVVPAWSILHRLGGRRVALIGATFIAVMPSLAPFTVPYWIGWDLWVGAEPLLHLFVFTGLALFLRAWQDGGVGAAIGCGAAFALAYLSRPEAIVVFSLLGIAAIAATALRPRTLRTRAWPIAACALAFVVVAAPYWLYLHDQLGRWAISGRGIEVVAPGTGGESTGSAPSAGIESMLWQDDEAYIRGLYALDPSGTALASSYWGVREDQPDAAEAVPERADAAEPRPTPVPVGDEPTPEPIGDDTTAAQPSGQPRSGSLPGVELYLRSLGTVIPWFLWPFAILGVFLPRRRRAPDANDSEPRAPALELLVALPLLATSFLIAIVVATDPRTQLFLAPLVAYYAARGTIAAGRALQARVGAEMRTSVAIALVAGTLALVLLGIDARRLYLSLAVGSPHHIVGAENAHVGDVIAERTPADATVMSWHPAIALYADRDWRVLPFEPMDRIVRYAVRQPDPYLVLSVFYPPPILQGDEAPHYLIVPIPPTLPRTDAYSIEIGGRTDVYATGVIEPRP